MSNLEITNNDLGSVVLGNPEMKDDLLTFGGAGTVLNGTILARKVVENSIGVAAGGGNVGDGTVTPAVVGSGPIVPIPGVYNLECVEAVAEGGVFKLEDPNGIQVAGALTMTIGAGTPTVFDVAGLAFTITDGGTDFSVGDQFDLTLTADGNMVPFAINGTGGAQVPKTVITYDVTAAGGGDIAIRSMISGQVRTERLIIDADGDGSNITDAILDQLRDYGITPVNVQELNIQDNQ